MHKLKFCLGCSWAKFLKDYCLGGWSGFGLVAEAEKGILGRKKRKGVGTETEGWGTVSRAHHGDKHER